MDPVRDYDIVRIGKQDSGRVLEFLKKFFFKDEPLNISAGAEHSEPGSADEDEFPRQTILEGVSCMALSGRGEVAGVCLSAVLRRHDPAEPDPAEPDEESSHPRLARLSRLLRLSAREADVFGMFPDVDRALDLRVLSVDAALRQRGVGSALIRATVQIAKEEGIRLVRVDCTSHYTAQAAARLGFHCIFSLNYSDHLDEAGDPVFQPQPPHLCFKTFVITV